jgi:mannose-1-phosphate guanylyltransferase
MGGHESMVLWAVNRATRLVPSRRIVAVVAEQHRRWWKKELADLVPKNVVVQPQNKGTAPGLLLPLLAVLDRDPGARILVLPSDHHVADEQRLSSAIARAVQAVDQGEGSLVLLGMVPGETDIEYGWILPAGSGTIVRPVAAFVEKPDLETARSLLPRGALLNSLIFVAAGRTLLELYGRALPDLLSDFEDWRHHFENGSAALKNLYSDLPRSDFSRDVLQRHPDDLSVVSASDCGWTDLGTPHRLEKFHREQLQNLQATA